MNNDYPLLTADPLVLLSNQHQSGLDLLAAKSNLLFNLNSNRSTEFIEAFNRVNEQRNFWRKGVLANIKSLSLLPKQLESRFSSNHSLYIDPRYADPNEIIEQLFSALQTDIEILAEVIDYASAAQRNNQDDQPAALLVAPSYYKDTKQLVFCNKIIDVAKGKDYALLCNSMFYNEKPRKQPQSLGDLLTKWQDPDHKNTKRIHNAVGNFNSYVAKLTTINDLLYIKNKQVHFNPRYV